MPYLYGCSGCALGSEPHFHDYEHGDLAMLATMAPAGVSGACADTNNHLGEPAAAEHGIGERKLAALRGGGMRPRPFLELLGVPRRVVQDD